MFLARTYVFGAKINGENMLMRLWLTLVDQVKGGKKKIKKNRKKKKEKVKKGEEEYKRKK